MEMDIENEWRCAEDEDEEDARCLKGKIPYHPSLSKTIGRVIFHILVPQLLCCVGLLTPPPNYSFLTLIMISLKYLSQIHFFLLSNN